MSGEDLHSLQRGLALLVNVAPLVAAAELKNPGLLVPGEDPVSARREVPLSAECSAQRVRVLEEAVAVLVAVMEQVMALLVVVLPLLATTVLVVLGIVPIVA